MAQLERLHKFKPDAVQWMIEQTQVEAEHRRAENSRLNRYLFINQILGQIFGFLIGLSGVIGGSMVAIYGQPTAGATIATVAIGTLAVVFVTGRLHKEVPQDQSISKTDG